MDTVTYAECIITTLTRRGKGEVGSPIRVITEIWERTGTGECKLIGEYDPCAPIYDRATGLFKEK